MILSSDQQAAADMFMDFLTSNDKDKKEFVIAGYSGSGKSTLVGYLIKAAYSKADLLKLLTGKDHKLSIHCSATTNKAADVLGSATLHTSQTIHSLLGLKVKQNINNGTTQLMKTGSYQILHNSLVIIDEASMINKELLKMIRESNIQCKILYVGDPCQLAPVFEDNCPAFNDNIPQALLTTIQRQDNTYGVHPITELGEAFRKVVEDKSNPFPKIVPNDVNIFHLNGPDFKTAIEQVHTGAHDINHSRLLAWSNNKVQQYNAFIRGLYTQSEIFEVGETVQTNQPIVVNGGTFLSTDASAVITGIWESTEYNIQGHWVELDNVTRVFLANNQNEVKALLNELSKNKDWVTFFQYKDFFADLRAMYASTIHKSQGSTYNTVFIDLADIGRNNKADEVARLLYVGITRATDKVYFYGELPLKYRG
jgi:exodeoxyribonuclease V